MVRLVHPDLSGMANVQQQFKELLLAVESVQHPNLPLLYDFGRAPWNGRVVLYTVGERLTGGSLRDLIDRGRALTPSQVVVLGIEACKALDALHRRGLVHGDVRPGTLVFGADSRVRVTDAGLAAILDSVSGGAATRINDVRFRRMVRPGETLDIEVELTERMSNAFFLTAKVSVGEQVTVRFEFACAAADAVA